MEKGSAKIAIIVLIILILAAGGFLGYKIVQNKNSTFICTVLELWRHQLDSNQ